jgi:hypothetical protein
VLLLPLPCVLLPLEPLLIPGLVAPGCVLGMLPDPDVPPVPGVLDEPDDPLVPVEPLPDEPLVCPNAGAASNAAMRHPTVIFVY